MTVVLIVLIWFLVAIVLGVLVGKAIAFGKRSEYSEDFLKRDRLP